MGAFVQDLKKDWARLPNLITEFRLVTFWVPGYLLFQGWGWLAAFAFIGIAATDLLDGWLARKRDEVTNLGKLLDPFADKPLVIATLVVIVATKSLNDFNTFMTGSIYAFTLIILFRETWVTIIRMYARRQGRVMAANSWGKIKMVCQVVAIAVVIVPVSASWWKVLTWAAIVIAAALTVHSGIEYSRIVLRPRRSEA